MSNLFTSKKIQGQDLTRIDEHAVPIPVDVYQVHSKLIILAPIAGITIEDISVSITDDLLVIHGIRKKPEDIDHDQYFTDECFWGEFSRSIVLPLKVDTSDVAAFYKRGILRIEIPIIADDTARIVPISVRE